MTETEKKPDPKQIGQGSYWQEISEGDRFRTLRRTITEADLVNFISVTGMLEAIFIDANYAGGAIKGRPVPGALTCALVEGMQFQTLIQGVGLAMLEMTIKAVAAVNVNDTIWAVIEIINIRPTSKNNRAVVASRVEIFNQRDELVMTYDAKRLVAGRPSADI